MVTIREVAKLAGVGTSTVSRYINNQGYVREETKEKIKLACESLQYTPNEIARSMKSKQSKTIGVMIPTINNPFFTELVHIIEQSLLLKGYKTVLCNTNGDIELEKNYMNMAITNMFDGIILITGSKKFSKLKTDIPIIFLDRVSIDETNYITITSDNKQGATLATGHLIDSGCKSLLYIGTKEENIPNKIRESIFVEIARKNNIEFKVLEEDEVTGERLEEEVNKGLTGIFAWNDMVAIKTISLLVERGYKIPQEVQIVGYDNIELSKIIHPKLTTIAQPTKELGITASDFIVNIIEKREESIESIQLKNELIIRETTIK